MEDYETYISKQGLQKAECVNQDDFPAIDRMAYYPGKLYAETEEELTNGRGDDDE